AAEGAVAPPAALGTPAATDAAALLAAAGSTAPSKAVRTAIRRALYRLRQAGIAPSPVAAAPRPPPARPTPVRAWASAVDGTGSRGVWLLLEGPLGERTLLSAVLNDQVGILDFAGVPASKKRLDEELRALRAESPLPWVEVPPTWILALLGEASHRHTTSDPLPAELARWLERLPVPAEPGTPPIYDRIPLATIADDPTLLDRSATLLTLPELAGWFLEP